MAEHTPGPWSVTRFAGSPDQVIGPNREDIASLYASDGADEPTVYPIEANARLIAAAPEMLEALREAFMHTPVGSEASQKARAAIAKAEGRAE